MRATRLLAAVALLLCRRGHGVALPAPRPPVDSQGVADLVSTFLANTKAGVVLYGRARALDTLLEQLAPETPRIRAFTSNLTMASDRLCFELASTDNIYVIAGDSKAQITDTLSDSTIPLIGRLLLWTRAHRPEDVLALDLASYPWLTEKELALAVSTPDGSSFLYNIAIDLDLAPAYHYNAAEIDRWSPVTRRWQRQGSPFTRLCPRWRSPRTRGGDVAPLRANAIVPNRSLRLSEAYIEHVTALMNSLRPPVRVNWQVEGWGVYREEQNRIFNCTLPVFVTPRSLPIRCCYHALRYASHPLTAVQVVVPAGMGRASTLA
ncbi:Ionotropic receptor 210, partial [Frankliniella occidentalis]